MTRCTYNNGGSEVQTTISNGIRDKKVFTLIGIYILEPHLLFSRLLSFIKFDFSILLDYLISGETAIVFLSYLLRYLKYLSSNIGHFQMVTNSINIEGKIIDVMHQLMTEIHNLNQKGMFTYNIMPLLKYWNLINFNYTKK